MHRHLEIIDGQIVDLTEQDEASLAQAIEQCRQLGRQSRQVVESNNNSDGYREQYY